MNSPKCVLLGPTVDDDEVQRSAETFLLMHLGYIDVDPAIRVGRFRAKKLSSLNHFRHLRPGRVFKIGGF